MPIGTMPGQGCGARFYDLNRENPQCPRCGAEYVAGNPPKPRYRAAPPEPPPAIEPEPVLPPEDEYVVPLKGVVETAEDDEDDLEEAKGGDDVSEAQKLPQEWRPKKEGITGAPPERGQVWCGGGPAVEVARPRGATTPRRPS